MRAQDKLLYVEYYLRDILYHAFNGGEFVLNTVYFYARHGSAFY